MRMNENKLNIGQEISKKKYDIQQLQKEINVLKKQQIDNTLEKYLNMFLEEKEQLTKRDIIILLKGFMDDIKNINDYERD
jgi:hypothetical protein